MCMSVPFNATMLKSNGLFVEGTPILGGSSAKSFSSKILKGEVCWYDNVVEPVSLRGHAWLGVGKILFFMSLESR